MVNHDKLKILEILTTDEGSKLIKEGSDDIDIDDSDSDSVCNSGTSGTSRSTSNSAFTSKSSNCSECESNTEEFNDD